MKTAHTMAERLHTAVRERRPVFAGPKKGDVLVSVQVPRLNNQLSGPTVLFWHLRVALGETVPHLQIESLFFPAAPAHQNHYLRFDFEESFELSYPKQLVIEEIHLDPRRHMPRAWFNGGQMRSYYMN